MLQQQHRTANDALHTLVVGAVAHDNGSEPIG